MASDKDKNVPYYQQGRVYSLTENRTKKTQRMRCVGVVRVDGRDLLMFYPINQAMKT